MTNFKAIIATTAAIAAGLGIGVAAMAADQFNQMHEFREFVPQIVVSAGRVHRTAAGLTIGTGAPVEPVSVNYRVSYADLDLTKPADVQTLLRRVEAVEHHACHQLDQLFPSDDKLQLQSCMNDVKRGASLQEQRAIAAVQSRAQS